MKRPSVAASSSSPKKKAARNDNDKDSDLGKLFVPGKLTGKNRGDRLDFDPFHPSLSCEELFGSLDGGPLVDAVVEFYKDEELTVPWFTKDAKGVEHRSVVRSNHSRELQEDTVTAYKHRILTEGLSQRVAGECIMKWQGPEKAFPAELGSFNHRAEAFYRAHAEDPQNYYVLEAKKKQLQRVSVLVWNTPEKVWSRLITILNKFHGGAGANIMDYLNEAIALENSWKTECLRTHVNTNNPKYMEIQASFVLQKAKSSDFNSYFSVWEHYKDALSLSHVMSRLEIREKFFSWCNRNVNFLMDGFQPQQALTQMHNLSLMILGNMRKYWDKKIQAIVMYEALKFCVPTVQTGKEYDRGDNDWIFRKPGLETTQLMNPVNLNMIGSTAVKKMTNAKAKAAPENEAVLNLKSKIKAEFHEKFLSALPSATKEPAEENGTSQGKQKQRSQHFAGYMEAEKSTYKIEIHGADGCRPLTALDEILLALRFAVSHIEEKENPEDPEESQLKGGSKMTSIDQAEKDMQKFLACVPKYEATLSFCIGIWFNFVFGGKCNVNGRECRLYTSLRTELQHVMVKAHENFEINAEFLKSGGAVPSAAATAGRKRSKASSGTTTSSLDALKLAQLLCETFVDRPVEAVDSEADDENQALDRIKAMLLRSDVTQPLTSYIANNMYMPLTMHSAPRLALEALNTSPNKTRMDFASVLAIILTKIDDVLPFAWFVLASDTSEILVERGHFPEGTAKVFVNQLNLVVIVQMRVKYMVSILRDAVMQLPEFSLDVSDTTQKLILDCAAAWLDHPAALPVVSDKGRLVASSEEKKLPNEILSLRHQMTSFDAIQPPSTWVVSWMEAFQTSENVTVFRQKLSEKTGIVDPPGNEGQPKSAAESGQTGQTWIIDQDAGESAKDDQQASSGAKEHQEMEMESDGAAKNSFNPSSMSLDRVNTFKDMNSADFSNILGDSPLAMKLRIKYFNASSMKSFERKLEAALWQVYDRLLSGSDAVQINLKADKKVDQVKISYPGPKTLLLPFMGTVQQGKPADRTSIKLGNLFGLDFYIVGYGQDLLAHDVVVPAWGAKTVNKADSAYFEKIEMAVPLVVCLPESSSKERSLMEVELMVPEEADIDVAAEAFKESDTQSLVTSFKLQCLRPLDSLEGKIDAELERQRGKADKIAQNMVNKSIKEASRAVAKSTGKPGAKAKTRGASTPVSSAALGVMSAEELQQSLADPAKQNELLQKMVQENLESIKKPDSLSLNVMASAKERASKSARAVMMQQQLAEVAGQENDEEPSPADVIGVKGAVAAFQRDGAIETKTKKGKDKDEKTKAASEMCKLGRHILK